MKTKPITLTITQTKANEWQIECPQAERDFAISRTKSGVTMDIFESGIANPDDAYLDTTEHAHWTLALGEAVLICQDLTYPKAK